MLEVLANLSDIGSFMIVCYVFYKDNYRNDCR